MGSQFAPASVPIVDAGNVPLVRINGLLRYEILRGGWAFSQYFKFDAPIGGGALVKRPCLELICLQEEQAIMRRFVEDAAADHYFASRSN